MSLSFGGNLLCSIVVVANRYWRELLFSPYRDFYEWKSILFTDGETQKIRGYISSKYDNQDLN